VLLVKTSTYPPTILALDVFVVSLTDGPLSILVKLYAAEDTSVDRSLIV
jgi:hypothetical protein